MNSDYSPFGMVMPARTYTPTNDYRYGFNGKEKDKNISSLTAYDYGFRIYNPALGRFLSVDPLTQSYPYYSPYQFSGNKPIAYVDVDGREEIHYIFTWIKLENGKEVVLKLSTWQDGEITGYDKNKKQFIYDKPYKIYAHYPSNVHLNGSPIFVTASYNSEEDFQNARAADFTSSCIWQGMNAGAEIGSRYADLVGLGFGGASLLYLGKEFTANWVRSKIAQYTESILTKEYLSKQILQALDKEVFEMNISAGAKLDALESVTPEAHFVGRHGAGTTLAQQQIRASTGLAPDGFQGSTKGINSSRFLSDDFQLEAYKEAEKAYAEGKVKDGVYTFDMKQTIGEGYLKGGKTYKTTTSVTAQFNDNGQIITIYPQLSK